MTREEAAEAFAKAMGAVIFDERRVSFWSAPTKDGTQIHLGTAEIPEPQACLSKHLHFVGKVAEALALPVVANCGYTTPPAMVGFGEASMKMASDPSWAAMLAAIEARRG